MGIAQLIASLSNSIGLKITDLVAKIKSGAIVAKRSEESVTLIGTNGNWNADGITGSFDSVNSTIVKTKAGLSEDIIVARNTAIAEADAKDSALKAILENNIANTASSTLSSAKAFAKEEIGKIVDVNNDDSLNTIKEIVEILGINSQKKDGVASIVERIGTKTSQEDFDAFLGSNKKMMDFHANQLASLTQELSELKNSIEIAVSSINGITFE